MVAAIRAATPSTLTLSVAGSPRSSLAFPSLYAGAGSTAAITGTLALTDAWGSAVAITASTITPADSWLTASIAGDHVTATFTAAAPTGFAAQALTSSAAVAVNGGGDGARPASHAHARGPGALDHRTNRGCGHR